MPKKNCWEVKKCGRQPGGRKAAELGECPTVGTFEAHRINNGINGGRACWAIAGTFCHGTVQGTFADKIRGCANCEFFELVAMEEAGQLVPVPRILEIMHEVKR